MIIIDDTTKPEFLFKKIVENNNLQIFFDIIEESKQTCASLSKDFQYEIDVDNLNILEVNFSNHEQEKINNILKTLIKVSRMVINDNPQNEIREKDEIDEEYGEQTLDELWTIKMMNVSPLNLENEIKHKKVKFIASLIQFFQKKLENRSYLFNQGLELFFFFFSFLKLIFFSLFKF